MRPGLATIVESVLAASRLPERFGDLSDAEQKSFTLNARSLGTTAEELLHRTRQERVAALAAGTRIRDAIEEAKRRR